jgi:phage/plasmid-associated DNA primase
MNMFKEITSPISSFVDECLEKVDDHITKERTSDLFGLWQWWCKNNGLDYEEKNVFVRKLLDANPGSRLIRHTIDGKPQIKVVTRIRINKAVKQSWTQGEVI